MRASSGASAQLSAACQAYSVEGILGMADDEHTKDQDEVASTVRPFSQRSPESKLNTEERSGRVTARDVIENDDDPGPSTA